MCCKKLLLLEFNHIGNQDHKSEEIKVQNTCFITLIASLAFVSVSPSSSFTDLVAQHSINVYFMTIGDTTEVPNLIAFGYC
ncbi:hypothetical protein C4D60_Mb11t01990 [Musa balbisiana]|uniref:Uncharacterized protein n=1 Tax=Musa balbisiana TaxID=52838 RepID=A0A4S8J140_MUSBA|nr:hypothetical protein C4D60_Mb11t01990 [Musa balbisiana]